MNNFQLCVFFLILCRRFISCTDIAAVYKHSVLLIKNADEISDSISWESTELDLPEPLAYPVGITYDSQNGRLFVADVMDIENNILTLKFSSNGSIEAMYPLLQKTHNKDIRMIEDIFYDERTSQLYWTDSYLNSLDKAYVPENPQDMLTEDPKPVHNFGGVKTPRGIALDFCDNLLYWSELDDNERNIEVCNLDGNYQGVVRAASDNKYFMGMTYDMSSGHVIWGETDGKELNSTCRIISSEFRGTSDHEAVITQLAELDNCYPFALTSDDDYIYWADWSRNGIMRLSKTNPDQIIKILDAPKVESDEGTHHGVFGLTVIGGPSIEEIEQICSHHHSYFDKKKDNQDVPVLKQTEHSIKAIKRVDPTLEIVTKKQEEISSDVNLSTPFPEVSKSTKGIVTEISSTEAQQSEKQAEPVTEINTKTEGLIKPQEKFLLKPFKSQETKYAQREPIQKQMLVSINQDKKERQPVVQGSNSEFVESEDYQSSQITIDEKTELCRSSVFHEQNLKQVVIGLGVGCIVFLSTTILLAVKLCLIKYPGYKRTNFSADLEDPPRMEDKTISRKNPRRFGPKNKKSEKHDLSSGIPSDGVTINIEDCCQMTLCDTPCYTSLKREGCSYKSGSLTEDKRRLLDDTCLNI